MPATDTDLAHLITGDTYELLKSELLIRDNTIDAVVTSPPYDGARTYAYDQCVTVDHAQLARLLFRVVKPGGIVAYNIQGPVRNWRKKGAERSTVPLTCVADFQGAGWLFHESGIYGRMGAPGAYTGRFRCDHEFIHFFKKPGAKHYWDKYSISREPLTAPIKGTVYRSRRKDGTINRRVASGYAAKNNLKIHGTVFDMGVVGHETNGVDHPAVMSLRLAKDLVSLLCQPGGTVLDPFSGSGTTAVACLSLTPPRRYVGLDSNEAYQEAAHERLRVVRESLRYPGSDVPQSA